MALLIFITCWCASVGLFRPHMKMITCSLTAFAPQVSRLMNMETVLSFREFGKNSVYSCTLWRFKKNDFAFNAVGARKQRYSHSTYE
jgi:hypothetical protein